jgi:hypothetical protein
MEPERPDRPCLSAVPIEFILRVLAALPLRWRLSFAAVCRACHTLLAEPCLWERLCLSPDEGGDFCTDAMLRAVSARAAAARFIRVLDVSGCARISHAALLAVVEAHAATLRELHGVGRAQRREQRSLYDSGLEVSGGASADELRALLAAAPALTLLSAAVHCSCRPEAAALLLRGEAPFERLRIDELWLDGDMVDDGDEPTTLAALLSLAPLPALRALHLVGANLAPAEEREALQHFVCSRRLASLTLDVCDGFSSADAFAALVTQLLRAGALRHLSLRRCDHPLLCDLSAARAAALFAALRGSALESLALTDVGLFSNPPRVAAQPPPQSRAPAPLRHTAPLLRALTGHASLRALDLASNSGEAFQTDEAACVALGALLAADAPALTALDISFCDLSADALRPLFAALPANTHLRSLRCHSEEYEMEDLDEQHNRERFLHAAVLPAVRANASLRHLCCYPHSWQAADQRPRPAEALVARRCTTAACLLPGSASRACSVTWLSLLPQRAGGDAAAQPLDARIMPPSCVVAIFGRVPVDSRLRCLEVCRSWRDGLGGNARVWQDLDLSPAGGCARVSDSVLLAAAAHAGDALRVLDVTDCGARISPHALSRVCASEFGFVRSLLQLRLSGLVPIRHVPNIRRSAFPQGDFEWLITRSYWPAGRHDHDPTLDALRVIEADVVCACITDACDALLRNNAHTPHVRVRRLFVAPHGLDASGTAL